MSTQSDAVAWLRFIEETDGNGMRAALLQTSVQGEPLAFCFSRVGRHESVGPWGTGKPEVLSSLAKSLFGATTRSPALILALADETPADAFIEGTRGGPPLCRVIKASVGTDGDSAHRDSSNASYEPLWVARHRTEDSQANRLVNDIMNRADPVEPFERAAKGLEEAFRDEGIQAATTIPGLSTTISLSSLPQRPVFPANRSSATYEAVGETHPFVQPPPTLAERLWALLAKPLEPNPDIRLIWPGELMPFQREGVQALLDNHHLLLADDMGLGKTLQAVAALRILRARREVASCLVAAPAGLLDQWRREIAKWAPEFSAIIIRGPRLTALGSGQRKGT